jgi:hypothetical protein
MSSAHKKVIVRRFTGETLPGYLPLAYFVHGRVGQPAIDLLDLSGRVISLLSRDIKHISYVRDFNLTDTANPERLSRRTFLARPRTEGLWLRMTFRTGDILEGLAPIDVSLTRRPHARCRSPAHAARHPLEHAAHLRSPHLVDRPPTNCRHHLTLATKASSFRVCFHPAGGSL